MRLVAWLASALPAFAAGCGADEIVVFRLSQAGASSAPSDASAMGGAGATPVVTGGVAGGQNAEGGASTGGRPVGNGGIIGTGGGVASGGAGGSPNTGGNPSTGGSPSTGGMPEDAGGAGTSCATELDCPNGWLCSKPDCSAPTGFCEPRPILCDPAPSPVCGCNNVTYWNDCSRRQSGIMASAAGQCGFSTLTCNTSQDCKIPGAYCAHVAPSSFPCGQPGPGTCWSIPGDCVGTPPSPRWMPCSGTGPGPGPFSGCVDTCTAIKSGQPYALVPPNMVCGP